MGLFDVFRKGLNKTRTFISEGLTKIAAGAGKFNDDMLDDFEELLVRADCGVEASVDIIDAVKSDIKKSVMLARKPSSQRLSVECLKFLVLRRN